MGLLIGGGFCLCRSELAKLGSGGTATRTRLALKAASLLSGLELSSPVLVHLQAARLERGSQPTEALHVTPDSRSSHERVRNSYQAQIELCRCKACLLLLEEGLSQFANYQVKGRQR